MPVAEPLRVAIDARYWRSSIQTGVERYIHLLTEALTAAPEPVRVAVVLTETQAPGFPADGPVETVTVPNRRERHLHSAVEAFSADVVHYPFALPARLHRPAVFTLHDAGRYLFPEQMVRQVRDVQNPRLLTQLDDPLLRAVITVSHASRAEILGTLGELLKPLEVVPNYVAGDFAQRLRHPNRALAPDTPFLFGVGVYMPSKNIPRLVRAFRLARSAAPDVVPARLLLAGRRGWERGLPSARDPEITVLGHIDDDQLAALYTHATAFVFPTLFEGFGIPAQEALAAGRPLLCSDLPVLREITGGLATFADPHDEDTLAKGIIDICRTPPPDHTAVQTLLGRYSAAVVGARLLDVYRRAALNSI
ncbi:glycosyltransferase family 4 protein [Nocardia miyunensis]|uniref:glycosyltransferase family 4 protein n=1 Tax=Nocardia miyunensis TaxID=282684 RepID=UPI00083169D3|nr:glycosyltransferase family 1 protein [Nocardia miyunensis]